MNTEKAKRLQLAHKFMEYVGECSAVYSMKNSIWERFVPELQTEHPILRMVVKINQRKDI